MNVCKLNGVAIGFESRSSQWNHQESCFTPFTNYPILTPIVVQYSGFRFPTVTLIRHLPLVLIPLQQMSYHQCLITLISIIHPYQGQELSSGRIDSQALPLPHLSFHRVLVSFKFAAYDTIAVMTEIFYLDIVISCLQIGINKFCPMNRV